MECCYEGSDRVLLLTLRVIELSAVDFAPFSGPGAGVPGNPSATLLHVPFTILLVSAAWAACVPERTGPSDHRSACKETAGNRGGGWDDAAEGQSASHGGRGRRLDPAVENSRLTDELVEGKRHS